VNPKFVEEQLPILRFAQDDSSRMMLLGLTLAGGEGAASTAGLETGATFRLRTSCADGGLILRKAPQAGLLRPKIG
jgi:hypothetical protein